MADYIPTTIDVRAGYARDGAVQPEVSRRLRAEFDRWLAEHDAELRAHLAGQLRAKAAQARATSAAFVWQQAARMVGGDGRG